MVGLHRRALRQGSACDFMPNDTYANRGFSLGNAPLTLDAFCYGTCEACPETSEINGCNGCGELLFRRDRGRRLLYLHGRFLR